ncbi:hypothetical protein MCHI_002800 [Candidatus Magnetoovum chiemensis]|nr:hypothetical protein MCHI_002800 [Candidatus Magnetoovum chiemensis]
MAGINDVAKQAISDAYSGLKKRISDKFGKDNGLTKAIDSLEAKPASTARIGVVQEEAEALNAEEDGEIVAAAKNILTLVQKYQPTTTTNTINVIGDGNQGIGINTGGGSFTQTFGTPPDKEKP